MNLNLPTISEIEWLKKNTNSRSPHGQLGFMLSLKCYQCLGYHISTSVIPKSIVAFMAKYIGVIVNKIS